ncbi:hypothetical protein SCL_1083 [Sulfuricaulis limicola]|uniref:Uncharacterized protein n=1 Tax=Sulfuricaulis limicola TaxID=1620215 RepID=A0A1B4XF18_9GAMM|nr:hypothetical protein [Sulfuricaulis limicola]BAV33397.1 hypothetical protein SCL_1083 [Sulfuricaulis limicola]
MRKIQQPPAPEIVYGGAKSKESVTISREVRAARLRGFDCEAINRIMNGLFDTIHNMPLNEADNRRLSTCGHA